MRANAVREAAQLGEAYSRAAYRLGDLVRGEADAAERQRAERRERSGRSRQAAALFEAWQAIFEAGEDGAELGEGVQRVAEEVAALRYVLRNVLRLAMETEGTEDYIRLAETYGMGCVRLRRLARLEEELRRGMAAARREEALLEALDEVEEEMGRR